MFRIHFRKAYWDFVSFLLKHRFCIAKFIFFNNHRCQDCERIFQKVQNLFQSSKIGEVCWHFQPTSKSQPFYWWIKAAISFDQDYFSYPRLRTNNDDTDSYHVFSFPTLNSTFSHCIQKSALTIIVWAKCAREDQWCYDL